ncbi:hypothetical protein [Paenibacillus naphthalenovorans]|uniref:hypothetical protein n=1 Tax=Paenibacillus naphthalenovorans TaxID=162209 RepID=UPI003D267646
MEAKAGRNFERQDGDDRHRIRRPTFPYHSRLRVRRHRKNTADLPAAGSGWPDTAGTGLRKTKRQRGLVRERLNLPGGNNPVMMGAEVKRDLRIACCRRI